MGPVDPGQVRQKAREVFDGLLVPRGLARTPKPHRSLPDRVAESLLAILYRQSGSWEEAAERAGRLLSKHLPRSKDAELVKSRAREENPTRLIGHISAELDPASDRYVASLSRLGLQGFPLEEDLIEDHERLLQGGFYAEMRLGYDPDAASGEHFCVENLEPIEASSGDPLETLIDRRSALSPGEWLCLLAWSLGLEPGGPTQNGPTQDGSGQKGANEKSPETGSSP